MIFTNPNCGDQIKWDKMNWEYSTHGRTERNTEFQPKDLRGKAHL